MKVLGLCMVLGVITGCVTTSQSELTDLTVGSTYQNSIVVGYKGLSMPLPEGDWKLISYDVSGNNSHAPFGGGYLVNVKYGVVQGLVGFKASLTTGNRGYILSSYCEEKDFLHIVKNSNYAGREQDCWGIDHVAMRVGENADPEVEQSWAYMTDNKMKIPNNMIDVTYRRTSKTRFLQAYYLFNPELEGISSVKRKTWEESDWNKTRIHLDKTKVAYVEKIKRWGAEWYHKVNAMFER